MIRINLLGVERQKASKAVAFDVGQRVTLACSLIVVVAALLIGWWWWSLTEESARVDAEIVAAQQEAARLQSLLVEVRQFEARRGQLQQRVALIEQLRRGQSVPVQLLDHVSRSLPDMLWLTEMVQDGGALTISGRSTTLIALSDFVGSLGRSSLLLKPLEIVESRVEPVSPTGATSGRSVESITFKVKAQIAAPEAPADTPGAPAAAAVAGPGSAAAVTN
ncbi:MAG TPA: PilN domain-containing protein [Vicinamibacterales bacterium]